VKSCILGPEANMRTGTEVERFGRVGWVVIKSFVLGMLLLLRGPTETEVAFSLVLLPTGSTFGRDPPDRKEGHSDLSSGREVDGAPMKERIAAASSNCTC
jgi:hypothetical protein